MPARRKFAKAALSNVLDKEVYQVVRKFTEEQTQYGAGAAKLTTSLIYDRIKRSNSSLNRKSKKLLEDSIERVVSVIQDDSLDGEEGELVEGNFDGMEEDIPPVNVMNKSIVGLWSVSRSTQPDMPSNGTSTPTPREREDGKTTTQTPLPGSLSDGQMGSSSPKRKERQSNEESINKRRRGEKPPKENNRSPPSHISLADLGGVESVVHELTELIALPMLYPEVYTSSGIQPPRGVLLHGPPGCGKTMIANAFAAELGVSFISISAPSIVSGMSGESEKKLREHFEEARKLAPCLIFLDEIDAITPKRESAQREMEKRIVAQMLTCMDDLALEKTGGKPVIIIAATNRPDSLDPALRRAGRFNKEINLSVPDETARELILRALTRTLRVADDVDFPALANQTPGFVGADLHDLVSTAGVSATQRIFDVLKATSIPPLPGSDTSTTPPPPPPPPTPLTTLRQLIHLSRTSPSLLPSSLPTPSLTRHDFLHALPKIQPSARREGFATIPATTWADVGALHAVRDELQMAVVEPIRRPHRYARVGITAPTGVLLWGPPGCGKTLLAKAVANESRANFISVKGPEVLNKYVGESERAVRQVFVRARSSVPCVIFFDELDALVPRRDDSLSDSSARVVNTLLTELDGLTARTGIHVIAATNRPDIIDPAMLRPGRLGTLLFVDLPGPSERLEILQTLMKKIPTTHATFAEVEDVARRCEGFSGADLESLLRAAGISALRREGDDIICRADFEEAMRKVKPSVAKEERGRYRHLRGRWG
ncbi:MAG: hypothetical protein M1833_000316 [Piccolia ochrophora]|nr:MAG: hypothetical protein M1833_000316 [Piccolia ochrophora]